MSSAPKLEPKKPSGSSRVVVKSQSTVGRGPAKTLSDVAREAGISVNVLRQLNPQLKAVRDTQTLSQAVQDSVKLPPKENDSATFSPSSVLNSPNNLTASGHSEGMKSPPTLGTSQRAHSAIIAPKGDGTPPLTPQGLNSDTPTDPVLGPARASLLSKSVLNASSSASPPRPPVERSTIRTIAIKHEFGVVDIVNANPSLAQLGFDDPLPQGTKLTLPRRTQPKFSVMQSACVEEEAAARQRILDDESNESRPFEKQHDDVMTTIHVLHTATNARRDLLLADVVEDCKMDYVGISGGDTSDPDYLAAAEETRVMLARIHEVATAADQAHWTAAILGAAVPPQQQGTPAAATPSPGLAASTYGPAQAEISGHEEDRNKPLSTSIADATGATPNSNLAYLPVASLLGSTSTDNAEGAAASPWGSVVKALHQNVLEAVVAERKALLESNVSTLRALIVRRRKLAALEAKLDARFEALHVESELTRRRGVDVSYREALFNAVKTEWQQRVAIVDDEGATRETLRHALFSGILTEVQATHSLRWSHQVRMAAASAASSPGKKKLSKPSRTAAAAAAAGVASVPTQDETLLSPQSANETDGVRFIIIAGDDTPRAVTPTDRSGASSFQLEDAHDEATVDPPTDSLATRHDVVRNETPDDLGRGATTDALSGEDQTNNNTVTRGSPTLDEGTASEMSNFSPEQKRDLASAVPDAATEEQSKYAAVPEQEASATVAIPQREERDAFCLWDYLPVVIGGNKSTFDEYDLRLRGDTATHVGFNPTSRGRALLRVPLVQPRHRIPSVTILRFRYAQTQPQPPPDSATNSLVSASLLRTPRAPDASQLPPIRPSPSKKRIAAPPAPQPSWQLYAVVPAGGGAANSALKLHFDSVDDLLPEGATLTVVARVNIPVGGGEYELSVDLNARTLMLRELESGTVVARDGLWSAESVGAAHDQLCLGATVTGLGSSITVLK